MSYSFDLVRLRPSLDPDEAKNGEAKEQLARALVKSHPSLEIFQPDFAGLAKLHNIDISEAKRRFRKIELNEERYSIQIILFDNRAAVSFSPAGTVDECKQALRFLWDCLKTLHSEGGFAIFDPQVDKLLNLDSDLDLVMKTVCGRRLPQEF